MAAPTTADRAASLFKFIRELAAIRQKSVLDASDLVWSLRASQLNDDDEHIKVAYKDDDSDGSTMLSVSKSTDDGPARELFAQLYKIHTDLMRDPETLEIVVANGFIRDRQDARINAPVITRRVKTVFSPRENAVKIEDADAATEFATPLLREMTGISLDSVMEFADRLVNEDVHPFDLSASASFLEAFVHALSPDSWFASDGDIEKWPESDRFMMYMEPCFIVRRRSDGALKALDRIIENIDETGLVPAPIADIVSGGEAEIPADDRDESIDVMLAEASGEDVNILLSKEANREQLEIARRIEKYSGVLVQGPPGTGKTHTIANLMGHFLAQGKRVLVTSHTRKALAVLKEKLRPEFQALCVSMADESNKDMERSVDGIIEYTSSHSSAAIGAELERTAAERSRLARELAETRRKIFEAASAEAASIKVGDRTFTVAEAAEYVRDNADLADMIPGRIEQGRPLPFSVDDLRRLYESGAIVSDDDEREASLGVPDDAELIHPEEFKNIASILVDCTRQMQSICEPRGWQASREADGSLSLTVAHGTFRVVPEVDALRELEGELADLSSFEPWMMMAASDGKRGSAFRERWIRLADQIDRVRGASERYAKYKLGNVIEVRNIGREQDFISAMKKLREIFAKKGGVSMLDTLFDSSLKHAMASVSVNGGAIASADDCALAQSYVELLMERKLCAAYWNDLMKRNGAPAFASLDPEAPEEDAARWSPRIRSCADLFRTKLPALIKKIEAAGIPQEAVMPKSQHASAADEVQRVLSALTDALPALISLCRASARMNESMGMADGTLCLLRGDAHGSSHLCAAAAAALSRGDADAYAEAYDRIATLSRKRDTIARRDELLVKLRDVAPDWADAIRAREGLHGEASMPRDIPAAWLWRQLASLIKPLASSAYGELHERAARLAKQYREFTARYAVDSAWHALMTRIERDIDLKQALQGWKLTVKKVGKGKGKNVAQNRAKARELMTRCQDAVPAWIMPVGRALEMFDPKKNRFDVMIVDEASQSDITELAVIYMADRMIIVGDDRQVSPMAVGVQADRVESIRRMHIEGVIPNYHLYDASTSIYDIAMTTFQALMLREHFRCVPEIIGYCNWLSYEDKIMPLRGEGSGGLVPPVVNIRVDDGGREPDAKENHVEAMTVAALMKACMEQHEYDGRTFGVISLLGEEQAKRVQSLIFEQIDAAEIEQRRIICGTPANFQGDERDVIFLSMVDSGGDAQLRLRDHGPGESNRKRYNVAVSRACDQLWVVDSLDPSTDLKAGDIRRGLIEYSMSPRSFGGVSDRGALSPFAAEIASRLEADGYLVTRRWRVGSYCLDVVVECGKTRAAIECDGERRGGDAEIRAGMEEQAILGRIGWKFMRLRASEYYLDPDGAMTRLRDALKGIGITPCAFGDDQPAASHDLLARIRSRATEIVDEMRRTAQGR